MQLYGRSIRSRLLQAASIGHTDASLAGTAAADAAAAAAAVAA